MRLVSNWDDVIPPPDKSDQQNEQAADNSPVNTLPDRTKDNRPPTAVDDQFGVRPGRTTLLPILDNDSDPDGDVFTARMQGEPHALGFLQSVYNGTGMQVTVPADATGAASSIRPATAAVEPQPPKSGLPWPGLTGTGKGVRPLTTGSKVAVVQ